MNNDLTVAPPSHEPLTVRIAPLVALVISLVAVAWVPEIARGQSTTIPRAVTLAIVAAVVWSCTLIVLYLVWRARALHAGWLLSMAACFLMLVTVKFILSPAEFFARGVALGRVVAVAAGVLAFYVVTVLLLSAGVRRFARAGLLALPWKVVLVGVAGLLILAAGSAAAPFVGSSANQYLGALFTTGFGQLLIVALLLTAILFVQALEYGSKPAADGSGRTALTATGVSAAAILTAYHVLWVILVMRLR